MSEIKTWNQAVEVAAMVLASAGRRDRWHKLSAGARDIWRDDARAALCVLRAAGLAIVPREVLDTINDWHIEGAEDLPGETAVLVKVGERVSNFTDLAALRALTAGEIKPPQEEPTR